jgi:hypothetical protein
MPELIPASYAKIRLELEREAFGDSPSRILLLLNDDRELLVHQDRLPSVEPQPGIPVWQSVIRALPAGIVDVEIAGWTGAAQARAMHAGRQSPPGSTGLILRGRVGTKIDDAYSAVTVRDATATVSSPEEKQGVLNNLAALAPSVAAPLPGESSG